MGSGDQKRENPDRELTSEQQDLPVCPISWETDGPLLLWLDRGDFAPYKPAPCPGNPLLEGAAGDRMPG